MASSRPRRRDGVRATSRHRNAIDATARESTRLAREQRQSRDRDAPRRLLRGEVEDYQPLHPDRLRPFTREAIEAEKREKWVSREFPDEIRARTSMADLRVRPRRFMKVPSLRCDSYLFFDFERPRCSAQDIAAELDERLRNAQWNLPDAEPAQQRLFVLLTDARNGSTGDLDVAHVLREAGKEWGKSSEWIEPVAAKNKKPKKPKRKNFMQCQR